MDYQSFLQELKEALEQIVESTSPRKVKQEINTFLKTLEQHPLVDMYSTGRRARLYVIEVWDEIYGYISTSFTFHVREAARRKLSFLKKDSLEHFRIKEYTPESFYAAKDNP